MFGLSKLREKIAILENALNSQREILATKEIELSNLQSKFCYNEGQFAMMQNLIKNLENQLKDSSLREEALRKALLGDGAVNERRVEKLMGLYEEKDEDVTALYKELGIKAGDSAYEGEL